MASPPPTTAPSRSPLWPGRRSAAERPVHQRRRRTRRILASQGVFDSIVSLAGILGRPVKNQRGEEIGRLQDLVARWSDGQVYPPVTGLVLKVGRRQTYVPAEAIDRLLHAEVILRSARLDLREVVRRPGEVLLATDVLDHQLVDVDGVQVIRAADLYLAEVLGRIRLVGADVSTVTLLRRLGPRRLRPQPTPDRVIDWAAIQPFSEANDPADEGPNAVRLRMPHEGLHRLRPGELADLLEDLRRDERQELLSALTPDEAADALEEMQADDLEQLLREAEPEEAARLLAAMEPDEAVDALRDLPTANRLEVMDLLAPEKALELRELLGYPEDEAGGIMTSRLVVASVRDKVQKVVRHLAAERHHDSDLDAVAVVNEEGQLVGDVTLLTILLALHETPEARVGSLLEDQDVIAARPHDEADEVAEKLVEARRLSIVVVDDDDKPIGRILADDLLDALVETKGRFHFPRLLS